MLCVCCKRYFEGDLSKQFVKTKTINTSWKIKIRTKKVIVTVESVAEVSMNSIFEKKLAVLILKKKKRRVLYKTIFIANQTKLKLFPFFFSAKTNTSNLNSHCWLFSFLQNNFVLIKLERKFSAFYYVTHCGDNEKVRFYLISLRFCTSQHELFTFRKLLDCQSHWNSNIAGFRISKMQR
jgi:hypothetical protein